MTHRDQLRRWKGIPLLVACILVLAACGSASSNNNNGTPKSTGPKVLQVAIGVDLQTMDPHDSRGSFTDGLIGANLFDGLVGRDPKTMAITPHVAERWEISPDAKEYTFFLRKGIKWPSGGELTAEDVKFSYERTLSLPQSSFQSQFKGVVTEIKIVDPHTIKFLLKEPHPNLLAKFNTQTGYLRITPKAYFDQAGEAKFKAEPVGSGPYSLKSWEKGQKIVLAANKDYFLGKPAYDEVIFLPIPDPATRVSALLSGQVDIIGPIDPEQADAVRKSGVASVETIPTTARIYLGFNSEKGPFTNVKLRQAVGHAIDIDGLIKNLLSGFASRLYAPIISFELGATDQVTKYTFDTAKAKQLIAEVSAGKKIPVTLQAPSGRYMKDQEVAQAIVQTLNEVGFDAKVQTLEWSVYIDKQNKHDMGDIYLAGYSGGGMFDADITMAGLYHSSHYRTYFKNKEIDDLIAKGRVGITPEARTAAYADAQKIITANAVHQFLWNQHDLWGVAKGVDWKPQPNQALWMPLAKPR